MRILALDVETTGFPSRSKPYDHPDQPYIVQVGLIERIGDRLVTEMSYMVVCSVEVPEGAFKIHGIDQETTIANGWKIDVAARSLAELVRRADLVVAHNAEFDRISVDIMTARCGLEAIAWPEIYCTMRKWSSVIGGKCPKLGEAYALTANNTAGMREHHALDDARKALAIYDHLEQREKSSLAV